jgi:Na+-transporting NADH:ubiquinone oxidoreductase subunit F
LVLLLARRVLVPTGRVAIHIDGTPERVLRVESGGTLLATLATERIFVPSACGGQGTCGTCTVTVHEGGGTLLPTERSHIGEREARLGSRLACQVKVKREMRITLPAEIQGVQRWSCRVRSTRNVATFIREIILELPASEGLSFRAGGYMQVHCPPHDLRYRDFEIEAPYRTEWDRHDLWRFASHTEDATERAYSMANYPEERGIVTLNVRIALPPPDVLEAPPGKVSSYLFGLRKGDEVTIAGPYGQFYARETDKEMCFVGGGAGMAPLRSHIFDQLERLHTKRSITFWYGARGLSEAFYVEDFDRLAAQNDNFDWSLALSEPRPEDRWSGQTGFIHQVLYDTYLEQHPSPEEIEYYLCGPPAMIDACTCMLDELGVPAENVLFDDFGG